MNNDYAGRPGRFSSTSLESGLCRIGLAACLGVLAQAACAGASEDKAFYDKLFARCNALEPHPASLDAACNGLFGNATLAGGTFVGGAVSMNMGTVGVQGTTSQAATDQQKRKEEKKDKGGGASADFHFDRLGFLISAQTGKTDRRPTDLENGFESKLDGMMLGVDYRFTDNLLIGLNVGDNDNRADFMDHAGTLRSKMTSTSLYLAYVPIEDAYLGAYVGTGRIRNSGTKRVLVGTVSGTTTSSNAGTLDMGGISGGYEWGLGSSARIGGYLNVDSARTRMDGYTEGGNTGLELIQPAQSTDSLTSTLGLRISGAAAFDWGTMLPEFRYAQVHEYRNNARTMTTAMAADPTVQFQVSTDAPDRNYTLTGVGVNFEVGNRTRWFIDYEKRGGHAFLSTWATSVGLVIGF